MRKSRPLAFTMYGSSSVVSQEKRAVSFVNISTGASTTPVPSSSSSCDQTWDGCDDEPSFDFQIT